MFLFLKGLYLNSQFDNIREIDINHYNAHDPSICIRGVDRARFHVLLCPVACLQICSAKRIFFLCFISEMKSSRKWWIETNVWLWRIWWISSKIEFEIQRQRVRLSCLTRCRCCVDDKWENKSEVKLKSAWQSSQVIWHMNEVLNERRTRKEERKFMSTMKDEHGRLLSEPNKMIHHLQSMFVGDRIRSCENVVVQRK